MSTFPSADLQESNTKESCEKWLLEVEKGLPVSRGHSHSGDLWFLFLFTACACFCDATETNVLRGDARII